MKNHHFYYIIIIFFLNKIKILNKNKKYMKKNTINDILKITLQKMWGPCTINDLTNK